MSEIKISKLRRDLEWELKKEREDCYEEDRNEELTRKIAPIDESFIYHVDRHVFNLHREKSIIQNVNDLMNCDKDELEIITQQNHIAYNTFPFGCKAPLVPRLLALCVGKTKLKDVFEEAIRHSESVVKEFDDSVRDKTVIIVTDKWDIKTFRLYEKKMLNYAVRDGIWFIFLLVTDYGYTDIPFLPYDRNALLNYREIGIQEDIAIDEMLEALRYDPIEYEIDMGTLARNESKHYIIGLEMWERRSLFETDAKGVTDKRELNHFLESVSWIYEIKEDKIERIVALDDAVCKLRIFGKTIVWDFAACGEEGYSRFSDLLGAINKLIEKCEKHKTK